MSAWDEYWAEGHLSSFPEDPKGIYSNSFECFWSPFLGTCHSVLEIAAGQGELTSYLYPHLQSLTDVSYVASDKANIDTSKYVERGLTGVTPVGRVDVESLPYGDAKFDLIVSQFGVEYAQWDESLYEIARCLKPKGKFMAICHDVNSVLIRQQRSYLLLETARMLISRIAELIETDDEASFLCCLKEIKHQFSQVEIRSLTTTGFLYTYEKLARGLRQGGDLTQELQSFSKSYIGYFERIEEMVTSAIDDCTLSKIERLAGDCGLSILHNEEVLVHGSPIGRGLIFQRVPAG